MKGLLAGGLGLAWLLAPTASHAQWESDAVLLNMNLGYASAQSRLSDDRLNAGTIGFGLDFIIPDQPVSFGVAAAFITADEDADVPLVGTEERRYHSASYYGTFKGWFGGERVKGYAGFGMGFHSARVESSLGSDYGVSTGTGFALAVPVGAIMFVGDTVFLNVNGTATVMGNSPYQDNFAWVLGGGLGFKI